MPYDPECAKNYFDGSKQTCPEVIVEDSNNDMPSRGDGMKDYVYYLFSQINKARADPQKYSSSSYIQIESSRL